METEDITRLERIVLRIAFHVIISTVMTGLLFKYFEGLKPPPLPLIYPLAGGLFIGLVDSTRPLDQADAEMAVYGGFIIGILAVFGTATTSLTTAFFALLVVRVCTTLGAKALLALLRKR